MEKFTSNVTGTGGLVTFADSSWLMSIVMFHQPHFRDQAENTFVFWGYGLRGDRVGDFVPKPMWDCTGDEVLSELAGHLSLDEAGRDWFRTAKAVLSRMPYITSRCCHIKSH
jgi:oleate hydratase